MSDLRPEYSRALASLDVERLVGTLSDDVTIRVAVHDAPMQGRQVASFLFGVLGEELVSMDVKSEIVEGERAVVLFETEIQGLAAQGVNVVEAGDGKVREITVYFRPLPALQRIAEVIGARMAERVGGLPPDS